jgi:hypothetical protein
MKQTYLLHCFQNSADGCAVENLVWWPVTDRIIVSSPPPRALGLPTFLCSSIREVSCLGSVGRCDLQAAEDEERVVFDAAVLLTQLPCFAACWQLVHIIARARESKDAVWDCILIRSGVFFSPTLNWGFILSWLIPTVLYSVFLCSETQFYTLDETVTSVKKKKSVIEKWAKKNVRSFKYIFPLFISPL